MFSLDAYEYQRRNADIACRLFFWKKKKKKKKQAG